MPFQILLLLGCSSWQSALVLHGLEAPGLSQNGFVTQPCPAAGIHSPAQHENRVLCVPGMNEGVDIQSICHLRSYEDKIPEDFPLQNSLQFMSSPGMW